MTVEFVQATGFPWEAIMRFGAIFRTARFGVTALLGLLGVAGNSAFAQSVPIIPFEANIDLLRMPRGVILGDLEAVVGRGIVDRSRQQADDRVDDDESRQLATREDVVADR